MYACFMTASKFSNINICLFKAVYKEKKDDRLDIKRQTSLLEGDENAQTLVQYSLFLFY